MSNVIKIKYFTRMEWYQFGVKYLILMIEETGKQILSPVIVGMMEINMKQLHHMWSLSTETFKG